MGARVALHSGIALLAGAAVLAGIGSAMSGAGPALRQARRSRLQALPPGAVKVTPATDACPPLLHSDAYQQPVPLGEAVNTAGGEDSAFVTPDGKTLYFFFTPDVSVPPQKQLLDGVTGIYVSRQRNGRWSLAERVLLQEKGELALDGCAFVRGNEMWFGSARKGNHRGVDIWTARLVKGRWTGWRNAGRKLNVDYEVGELHVTADGRALYFHSERAGGVGQSDIWVTRQENGEWGPPENLRAVNTPGREGWPFVTQDGRELWFTRFYQGAPAIFRARKAGGQWGVPELILSRFAAEPSLDRAGNLYFTHHYLRDGRMIEADIYMARRREARRP